MGSDSGMLITIGMRVTVRLVQAAPVTGGLELELLALEDAELPKGGGSGGRGKGRRSPAGRTVVRRKAAKAKHKAAKDKRKVTRTRK